MSQTAAHAPAKAAERTASRPSAAAASPAAVNLAGNQAIQAMLRGGWLRPKLELGAPDDPEEREADATAERVLRMPEGACCSSCAGGGACGDETLRRKPSAAAASHPRPSGGLERQMRRLTAGGEVLSPGLRGFFEPRLGRDLGAVRIHRGHEAQRAAGSIRARAFTVGQHVGFGAGQWAPDTDEGRRLLAHELAHTGQAARAVRRDGPVPPDAAGVTAAANVVIDALEGYTSGTDSENILAQFRGKSAAFVLALVQEVKNRGSSHGKTGEAMVDWLLGDLTEENRQELRRILVQTRSPDVLRIVAGEIKDRLDGYTSEADSAEIVQAFAGYAGNALDDLLARLLISMGLGTEAMWQQLFGDLDRVSAERLRQHFFAAGGPQALDWATRWTARKIMNLVEGFTGHADSTDIVWNLSTTPTALRGLVQVRLDELCTAGRSQSAEDALMQDMDQGDYERLRALGGLRLRAYDRQRGVLDTLVSGADWVAVALSWTTCGMVGVATGLVAAVWDILKGIKDIVVAIWDLLWSLIYLLSNRAAGSENWLRVKTFFIGIGHLFSEPGKVWDQYWEEQKLEFQTIEGPLSDCRRAEYVVRKFIGALVNVVLIFVAGYGIAKGAVSGARAVAGVAELAEVVGVRGVASAGARLAVRGAGRFVAVSAEAARGLLAAVSRPATLLRSVATRVNTVLIAAQDVGYWQFLRSQAGAAAEGAGRLSAEQLARERRFWAEQREFWQTRAAEQQRRHAGLGDELVAVQQNLEANRAPENTGTVADLGADAARLDIDSAALEAEVAGRPLGPTAAQASLPGLRADFADRLAASPALEARLQVLERRSRDAGLLQDPRAAADEAAAIAREAAMLRTEMAHPELAAEVDALLRLGPPGVAPSPAEVARAVQAVRAGTATREDLAILVRRAVEDARGFIRANADRPLAWQTVAMCCGPGRDCSAASLGSLLSPEGQAAVIRRYQSLEVFGVNKHGFATIELAGPPPARYLVDPTFGQFMRPGSTNLAADATAQVLRTDPEMLALGRDLLRDGFVPLTERNARIYAQALGAAPAEAELRAPRLIQGSNFLTEEPVGGPGRGRPIGSLADTPDGPDILDAAELRGFCDSYIAKLRREGDPAGLLPILTDLRARLDALARQP